MILNSESVLCFLFFIFYLIFWSRTKPRESVGFFFSFLCSSPIPFHLFLSFLLHNLLQTPLFQSLIHRSTTTHDSDDSSTVRCNSQIHNSPSIHNNPFNSIQFWSINSQLSLSELRIRVLDIEFFCFLLLFLLIYFCSSNSSLSLSRSRSRNRKMMRCWFRTPTCLKALSPWKVRLLSVFLCFAYVYRFFSLNTRFLIDPFFFLIV